MRIRSTFLAANDVLKTVLNCDKLTNELKGTNNKRKRPRYQIFGVVTDDIHTWGEKHITAIISAYNTKAAITSCR